MKILLVDDDRESREVIADFLRMLGHSVEECADGKAACCLTQNAVYALIISDMHMPGMSGGDLFRALNAPGCLAGTPFILCSGDPGLTAGTVRQMGMYGYLPKPLEIETLADMIQELEDNPPLAEKPNRLP